MRQLSKFEAVVTTAFLTAIATSFLAIRMFFSANPIMENVVITKVFFTSFNIVVLAALTLNYYEIYSDIHTDMSRGLLIFSAALLFYALTSSPVLHVIFGFEAIRVGFFTYMPHAFVSVASLMILYESYR